MLRYTANKSLEYTRLKVMGSKLADNLLPYFSSTQASSGSKKIKHLVTIFVVTAVFVVIYQKELVMKNLSLGKNFIYITPEDQVNDTILLNQNQKFNLNRKKDVFLEMKNIQQSIKNIFFTESRCGTEEMKNHFNEEKLNLNPRQVCAVESTALTNPEHDIYILYTCPLAHNFLLHLPDFSKELINYPNVYIIEVNATEAFMDTPVEELYKSKKLESSSYPVEHFSDLLRFIILWKFGGTYLDLDVVTIKSLLDLGTNYAGIEDWSVINSAVLNVEPFGTGHELIQKALEFVNKNYNGKGWSSNGPEVLTKVILESCSLTKVDERLYKCEKFHLLPSRYFYHIHWSQEQQFFDGNLGPKIVETLKNSSYVVHLWNKLSYSHTVDVGSNQAYELLANEFCPNVIKNCGNKF